MLLKKNAKEGFVTDQVLNNLRQAWTLRCGGSVDENENEDLRIILEGMQPGWSGPGTTDPVGGSQGSLVDRCSSSSFGTEREK